MAIKNRTSTVPFQRSLERIEKLLVELGAISVLREYDGEALTAVSFQAEVDGKLLAFRVPARVDAIYNILVDEHPQTSEQRLWAQAQRTAWRIAHEWVAIQVSYIQMEQAEFLQLFMSHLLVPGKDKPETFYERVKAQEFEPLLLAPKE